MSEKDAAALEALRHFVRYQGRTAGDQEIRISSGDARYEKPSGNMIVVLGSYDAEGEFQEEHRLVLDTLVDIL